MSIFLTQTFDKNKINFQVFTIKKAVFLRQPLFNFLLYC